MNMFKEVNRIIFDLDNTLIKHDFEEENILLSEYLKMENELEFKRQLGNMFQKNSCYLKCKAITEEYFIEVIENFMPVLKKEGKSGIDVLIALREVGPGNLMYGAKELLEYLYNKGYQLIVLSNWFYNHQSSMLKKFGIFDYFERIYTWDNYYAKPNRLAMIRALDGTDPRNNVIIGDDPVDDITLGKNCDIHTIGFNIDYSKIKKCKKIKMADVNVSTLAEIKYYL